MNRLECQEGAIGTRTADKTSRLKAGFPALVRNFGVSVGIAAFVIGILVTYDIFTRTLFAMSNSWVTEVCTYLMAYITFGGAAYALKEGAHVKVDLLVDLVPPAAKRVLGLVTDSVMLVVVAMLAWLSFEFWRDAWTSGEKSPSLLATPFWIPYLFFVLGMVWLLIALLTHLLAGLKRRKTVQFQGNS
jgi:TRAP-type C4-dicarboxylate transport system permease small subunit